MWSKTTSKVYPGVKAAAVWNLWADVDGWTTWHPDLEYCRLQGPFAVGSHFLLRPKGAPEFKIGITELTQGVSFTDCTRFFGARMYDTHEMQETPEGLRLTNTMTVTGPLSWLWVKLVAADVAASVPEENEALVRLART